MANKAIYALTYGQDSHIFTLPYGTCSTPASTAAKTVAVQDSKFSLETGARVLVKFTVTNSASSPTLNVSSTGAKSIFYRGTAITASYLAANRVYEFVYDGTNWELIGDVDTDTKTTYSAATQSAAGLMSAADKTKLDGIATGANKYTHPTTAGNKHIPSGGSSGQFLKYSASGTATWSSLPAASGTAAGITIVYPAASCTTFTSDAGTCTPAAVRKAVGMFDPKAHNHSASNITSGTLPVARGGTGATTVDGILSNLGISSMVDMTKYSNHCWIKYDYIKPTYSLGPDNANFIVYLVGKSIQYSSSISVAHAGEISLVNPSTSPVFSTKVEARDFLNSKPGKYVLIGNTYYVLSTTNKSESFTGDQSIYLVGSEVMGIPGRIQNVIGIATSSNSSAYPVYGFVDSVFYEYIGIPYNNLPYLSRCSTRSYVGTDTYGIDNPNSITFDFRPKLLIFEGRVQKQSYDEVRIYNTLHSYYLGFIPTEAIPIDTYRKVGPNAYVYIKKSADGKTITWYGTSVDYQNNYSNSTYYVTAIG